MAQEFTDKISGNTLKEVLEGCNRLVAETGSKEAWRSRHERILKKSVEYIDGLVDLYEHHKSVHKERLSEVLFRHYLLEQATELPSPEMVPNLNDWLVYLTITAPLLSKAKKHIECAQLLVEEFLMAEVAWEEFWDWKQSGDSAVPNLSEQGGLSETLTEMRYRGHRLAFLSSKFAAGKADAEALNVEEPQWLNMS